MGGMGRYNAVFANGLFDFVPHTFTLPKEYVAFANAFAKAADKEEGTRGGEGDPNNYWILKPTSSSRGRGIYLVQYYYYY